jgi:hypothetical protein
MSNGASDLVLAVPEDEIRASAPRALPFGHSLLQLRSLNILHPVHSVPVECGATQIMTVQILSLIFEPPGLRGCGALPRTVRYRDYIDIRTRGRSLLNFSRHNMKVYPRMHNTPIRSYLHLIHINIFVTISINTLLQEGIVRPVTLFDSARTWARKVSREIRTSSSVLT